VIDKEPCFDDFNLEVFGGELIALRTSALNCVTYNKYVLLSTSENGKSSSMLIMNL
jgi:ABC-type arginine transport system ATPase subunit